MQSDNVVITFADYWDSFVCSITWAGTEVVLALCWGKISRQYGKMVNKTKNAFWFCNNLRWVFLLTQLLYLSQGCDCSNVQSSMYKENELFFQLSTLFTKIPQACSLHLLYFSNRLIFDCFAHIFLFVEMHLLVNVQAASDCEIEPLAYELFTQAFVLYEEEVAVIFVFPFLVPCGSWNKGMWLVFSFVMLFVVIGLESSGDCYTPNNWDFTEDKCIWHRK